MKETSKNIVGPLDKAKECAQRGTEKFDVVGVTSLQVSCSLSALNTPAVQCGSRPAFPQEEQMDGKSCPICPYCAHIREARGVG